MKNDITLALKRIRKRNKTLWPKVKLSYYLTAELGAETMRPHFHAIIFNLHDSFEEILKKEWKMGMFQVFPANEAMINYTTGYFLEEEKTLSFT